MSLPRAETGCVTAGAFGLSTRPCAPFRLLPRVLRLLGSFLAVAAWGLSAAGQTPVEEVNREYLIKAAFLYNFARYVQWPTEGPDSKASFVIGLLQPEPFGTAIEQVRATKNVGGRPILIERFASMAEYRPCHILFVAAGVPAREKTLALRETREKPVLVVGEEPNFAVQGAVINFFPEDNRIRFEINVEAAKQRQLQISSKLLTLGKLVGP